MTPVPRIKTNSPEKKQVNNVNQSPPKSKKYKNRRSPHKTIAPIYMYTYVCVHARTEAKLAWR